MIAVIAAYAKNRVIGNKGRIPWDIPDDRRRFREITTGSVVVMGRKTYEEIGRPLPDRICVVISSNPEYKAEGCLTAASLCAALKILKENERYKKLDIYICGGAQIYKESVNMADKLYLSVIDSEYEGDVYFPEFDAGQFECVYSERVEGNNPYTFYELSRKKLS